METDKILSELRVENSSLAEANSQFKLCEINLKDRLALLQTSLDSKIADYQAMSEQTSLLREQH